MSSTDRSSSDRDGANGERSVPLSEPSSANPGYAAEQLTRALRALDSAGGSSDPATHRVVNWWKTLQGMLMGALHVGSRTPVGGVPAWATPHVAAGGFATGRLMAGGPLQDAEIAWLAMIGQGDSAAVAVSASAQARLDRLAFEQVWRGSDWKKAQAALQTAMASDATAEQESGTARLAINRHLLTEPGVAEMLTLLANGHYRAKVPEEVALLFVTWLAAHGYGREVDEILGEISGWFSRLRFYPQRANRRRSANGYCVHTVADLSQRLERVTVPTAIRWHREVTAVMAPLHDRLVALWLETLDDVSPPHGRRWCRSRHRWRLAMSALSRELATTCARLGP